MEDLLVTAGFMLILALWMPIGLALEKKNIKKVDKLIKLKQKEQRRLIEAEEKAKELQQQRIDHPDVVYLADYKAGVKRIGKTVV